MNKRLTSTECIQNATVVHGARYDYTQVNYKTYATPVSIECADHGTFTQTPANHISGRNGYPRCAHRVSKPAVEWLAHIGLPNTPQHREVRNLIPNRNYEVDGYNPDTLTVYEFLGDYWHGNPDVYDPDIINASCKVSFGELYNRTINRRQEFIDAGYQYVEMWEKD